MKNIRPRRDATAPKKKRVKETKREAKQAAQGEQPKSEDTPKRNNTNLTPKAVGSRLRAKKSLPCGHCGKIFSTHQNLQSHERIHFGVQPYKCDQCDTSFVEHSSLYKHKKTHLMFREAFVCMMCDATFVSKLGYMKHQEKQHPEVGDVNSKQDGGDRDVSSARVDHVEPDVEPHIGGVSEPFAMSKEDFDNLNSSSSDNETLAIPVNSKQDGGDQDVSSAQVDHVEPDVEPHIGGVSEPFSISKEDFDNMDSNSSDNETPSPTAPRGRILSETPPGENDNEQDISPNNLSHQNEPDSREKNQVHSANKENESSEKKSSYKCENCPKQFRRLLTLWEHINSAHTGAQSYPCLECDEVFSCSTDAKAHHQKEHRKQLKCKFCNKMFRQQVTLDGHLRHHTGEKPFSCNVCDRSFSHYQTRDNHMRLHTQEKAYRCQECDFRTCWRSSIKAHILIHQGKRPHACGICPMRFTQKSQLKRHETTSHHPDKSCQICGQYIKSKKAMLAHKAEHDRAEGFSCNHCQETFHQQYLLTKHIQKCHILPHRCGTCGAAFPYPSGLKAHKLSHSKPKSFPCDFENCVAKFTRFSNLKAHMRIHMGMLRFGCDQCDRRYDRQNLLDVHVQNFHNAKLNRSGPRKSRYRPRAAQDKDEGSLSKGGNAKAARRTSADTKQEETDIDIAPSASKGSADYSRYPRYTRKVTGESAKINHRRSTDAFEPKEESDVKVCLGETIVDYSGSPAKKQRISKEQPKGKSEGPLLVSATPKKEPLEQEDSILDEVPENDMESHSSLVVELQSPSIAVEHGAVKSMSKVEPTSPSTSNTRMHHKYAVSSESICDLDSKTENLDDVNSKQSPTRPKMSPERVRRSPTGLCRVQQSTESGGSSEPISVKVLVHREASEPAPEVAALSLPQESVVVTDLQESVVTDSQEREMGNRDHESVDRVNEILTVNGVEEGIAPPQDVLGVSAPQETSTSKISSPETLQDEVGLHELLDNVTETERKEAVTATASSPRITAPSTLAKEQLTPTSSRRTATATSPKESATAISPRGAVTDDPCINDITPEESVALRGENITATSPKISVTAGLPKASVALTPPLRTSSVSLGDEVGIASTSNVRRTETDTIPESVTETMELDTESDTTQQDNLADNSSFDSTSLVPLDVSVDDTYSVHVVSAKYPPNAVNFSPQFGSETANATFTIPRSRQNSGALPQTPTEDNLRGVSSGLSATRTSSRHLARDTRGSSRKSTPCGLGSLSPFTEQLRMTLSPATSVAAIEIWTANDDFNCFSVQRLAPDDLSYVSEEEDETTADQIRPTDSPDGLGLGAECPVTQPLHVDVESGSSRVESPKKVFLSSQFDSEVGLLALPTEHTHTEPADLVQYDRSCQISENRQAAREAVGMQVAQSAVTRPKRSRPGCSKQTKELSTGTQTEISSKPSAGGNKEEHSVKGRTNELPTKSLKRKLHHKTSNAKRPRKTQPLKQPTECLQSSRRSHEKHSLGAKHAVERKKTRKVSSVKCAENVGKPKHDKNINVGQPKKLIPENAGVRRKVSSTLPKSTGGAVSPSKTSPKSTRATLDRSIAVATSARPSLSQPSGARKVSKLTKKVNKLTGQRSTKSSRANVTSSARLTSLVCRGDSKPLPKKNKGRKVATKTGNSDKDTVKVVDLAFGKPSEVRNNVRRKVSKTKC